MKRISPFWLSLWAVGAAVAQSTINFHDDTPRKALVEPDVILQWNAAVSDHFDEFSAGSTAHIQARVYVLVHVAMRDAIAAVVREVGVDSADPSAIMAAGTAAHDVSVALCPTGVNRFAVLQAHYIAVFSNGTVASVGRQIGQKIAATVLSSRANDSWPIALAKSQDSKASRGSRRHGGQPTPFILRRLQEFRPPPPFFEFPDGKIRPNRTLQSNKLLGSPADVELTVHTSAAWSTEPLLLWNRAVWSHAVLHAQTLPDRARLFAAFNSALADALLSATYWAEVYRNDRGDATIRGALHEYDSTLANGDRLPDASILSWATKTLKGFPPTPAVLAGAAESVLRSRFDDSLLFNMRRLARQCAWSTLANGGSTVESCVAGYDLGHRIGAHVQEREP